MGWLLFPLVRQLLCGLLSSHDLDHLPAALLEADDILMQLIDLLLLI